MNIDSIEELNELNLTGDIGEDIAVINREKINELIKAVKQLNEKIGEK